MPSNVPADPQANTIGFDQYKALYVRLWKAFDPTRKLLESDVEASPNISLHPKDAGIIIDAFYVTARMGKGQRQP